jgi:colanic acid/amylovoran biosynthesis protein
MRILVESGSLHCLNLGDVAMMQVAVARLKQLWPAAEIVVFTRAADLLRQACPSAVPLDPAGRDAWFTTATVLRRAGRRYSAAWLGELDARWHQWLPAATTAIRLRSRPISCDSTRRFSELLATCDLLVASGAGQFTTSFADHSTLVLDTMQAAIRRGIPVVLFGQGIGPIEDSCLFARARAVLPYSSLICLREAVAALPLLDRLGVGREKVVITGDDAIELAYRRRRQAPGNALGVNLRLASYSGLASDSIDLLRGILQNAAHDLGAPLAPIAISIHPEERDDNISMSLLEGYPAVHLPKHPITTPTDVIDHIGNCRVVVTMSYHGGVFALSQGIPVIALSKSKYYASKLLGLSKQFGTGCEVICLDDEKLAQRLKFAIIAAWESAPLVRPDLLGAAIQQIAAGTSAYERAYRDITGQEPVRLSHGNVDPVPPDGLNRDVCCRVPQAS